MGVVACIHFDAEAIEDEWARVGGSRAECVEVDGFAGEVLQSLDFRADEDMQFGWEQMHQIVDAFVDLGDFRIILKVVEHITIDNRRVYTLEVQEVMDVFEWPPRHDWQDAHLAAVIDGARKLDREP